MKRHRIKRELLTATGAAAVMLLSQSAHATTVVATIIGAYDSGCGSCGLVNGTTITSYATNGGTSADTPSLFFLNPTGQSFTNITLTLTGYQDAANGGTGATLQNPGPGPAVTQTLTLPNIAANSVYKLTWFGLDGIGYGSAAPIPGGSVGAPTNSMTYPGTTGVFSLFGYDYDDTGPAWTDAAGAGTKDSLGNHCGSGSGTGTTLCAYVGNFDVKFSAMLGGTTPIAADFSPDNTQGGGNVAGKFVGWEGLDADGLSETSVDAHSLTFPGTLAVITTGTAGLQNGVPEPGTLALLGSGLGALALVRRRRKPSPASA